MCLQDKVYERPIVKGALKSTSFISISTIDFTHRRRNSLEHLHTRATVESFLEENLLSDLSRVKTGRSRDLWGPKDVSYLVDDPPGKAASKIRHDHPDLERSDNKFFSRNDSTISKRKGVLSKMNSICDF